MLDRSAGEIRAEVAAGRVSATEVCRAFLERISAVDPSLNAFRLVDQERALQQAAEIDRRRSAGHVVGPLAGVPIALKDNLCVRGMRTSRWCAGCSIMLFRMRPSRAGNCTCTVVHPVSRAASH